MYARNETLPTQAGSACEAIENPDAIIPDEGQEEGVTVVFFHADWCGHCKQLMPIFQRMALNMNGRGKFQTVNSDIYKQSRHAGKLQLQGFPTIHVFKNGILVETMVGNQGEPALEALLNRHM